MICKYQYNSLNFLEDLEQHILYNAIFEHIGVFLFLRLHASFLDRQKKKVRAVARSVET